MARKEKLPRADLVAAVILTILMASGLFYEAYQAVKYNRWATALTEQYTEQNGGDTVEDRDLDR